MYAAPVFKSAAVVASNEKTLSPATRSPCVPSSYKTCDGDPPMADRFATTPIPVLGCDPVAGFARTVSSASAAGRTASGVATPTPDNCVGSAAQEFAGARLFRGIGPTATKSAALLSLS